MAEAATETQAAPAAPAAQPTEAERIQAAIEKGKEVAKAKGSEETATDEEPKPEATEAEEPAAETKPEEPAAAEEAKPEDDAKTKRAKEWASINRVKQAQATKARELKRTEEELTKTRADLQVIQQQLVELNRLRTESPKKFIEALGAGSGGMRRLFEEALQEEKRSPEEEKELARERRIAELEEKLKKRDESEEARRRQQEEQQRTQQTREWHEQNYKRTQDVIGDLVKEGAYPNVAGLVKTRYGMQTVASDIYNRILAEWERTGGQRGGRERPIPEVLDDVEAELAKEAGVATDTTSPSARANGAEPTAKPEAKPKRTPPSLTNAQASARASAGRELKGEERMKYFASMLRTRPY